MPQILFEPWVSTLLLTITFVTFIVDLFRPTHGILPGIGVIALIGWIAIGVLAGRTDALEVIMLIAGFVLLGFEAILAGFGIVGISGILLVLIAVTRSSASPSSGLLSLFTAALAAVLVGFFLFKAGYRSERLNKMTLNTRNTPEEGYQARKNLSEEYIGKRGVALTNLRPAGTVLIGDERLDAITRGEFIAAKSPVEVFAVSEGKLTVRAAEEPAV